MAERKKYKHKRFSDQDSIRLLQLQPGAFDDDIRITLIEAPLSKPPKYEALSYVWGSPTPDAAISCHGLELLVTENCVLAMRRLRRRSKTRLLWIDAICIDQTSGEEKQHQVQLMGDVYSKAEEVNIWLGEKCAYSDFVMSLLSNYSAITTSIWRRPIRGRLLDKQIRKLREEENKAAHQDGDRSKVMESITLRPWFTRVWTIQEYIMSRKSQLVCGNKIIDTERFFKVLSDLDERLYDQYGFLKYYYFFNDYIQPYRGSFFWLRLSLVQRNFNATKVSLTQLLGYIQCRSSTNRRDSIDGLCGIVQKLRIDFPLPDYSRSIRDVFTEAAKCAIIHDKSLALLVGITGDTLEFPCWVPDWSREPESNFFISEKIWCEFRASRKSASIYKFLDGVNCLLVRGVTFDTVTCCTASVIEFPGGYRDFMNICFSLNRPPAEIIRRMYVATRNQFQQWIVLVKNLHSHRYPNGLTVYQALFRTLCLANDENEEAIELQENIEGENSGASLSPRFELWLLANSLGVGGDFVKDVHTSLERRFPGKLPKLEDITTPSETGVSDVGVEILTLDVRIQFFLAAVIEVGFGTKFFTTSAQYMGIALPSVQEGDVVMLISGVNHPMIARKTGETYRLVSPAYVFGIMNGEKWPENEEDLMDIVLS